MCVIAGFSNYSGASSHLFPTYDCVGGADVLLGASNSTAVYTTSEVCSKTWLLGNPRLSCGLLDTTDQTLIPGFFAIAMLAALQSALFVLLRSAKRWVTGHRWGWEDMKETYSSSCCWAPTMGMAIVAAIGIEGMADLYALWSDQGVEGWESRGYGDD